jgi:BirA family biotin operon repressor/biotin-[acetyl-CoA-carboxylase] ligase
MDDKIIEYFKSRDDFISGEEISRSLGITRAGLWKRVNMLRQKGYEIQAVPSKGYKLLAVPDMPTREEIRSVFRGDIIGRDIIFYEETSSTNDRAMEIGYTSKYVPEQTGKKKSRKKNKVLEGMVIVADSQVRGRGRFDRGWISPPGVNLYFTVLLEPPFSAQESSITTLMAAVAVVSAIREYTDLKAEIKWPNDILINRKKVGGILTEMKSDIDGVNFIAVGIGINVNMTGSMLPEELRPVSTSLLQEKAEHINRVELMGLILERLEFWYKALLKGSRKTLLDEWIRLNATVGNKVMVKAYERVITGIAEGINSDGGLIVRDASGSVETVNAGEVTILKN